MNWITNAATEIAAGIVLDAEITNSRDGIASIIIKHAEPLIALLRESRREHSQYCSITEWWQSTGGGTEPVCTCGADAWNARIDAVLNA